MALSFYDYTYRTIRFHEAFTESLVYSRFCAGNYTFKDKESVTLTSDHSDTMCERLTYKQNITPELQEPNDSWNYDL